MLALARLAPYAARAGAWLAFSRSGRVVALIAILAASAWLYGRHEARDAIAEREVLEARKDAAAVVRREENRTTIGRESDEDLINRLAGPR